ncbi:hypothetical protein Isop_0564 [Isosphaera pallida ATCC 43644]|uniref:Uncharacterized protein n=1 Tax=Isosphaera pallida (strain ATCC 43644 / DSM 9630 / IS1B) TaxID=575540 RepID=E8R039_ISOPI|nr:hypothetical protein [Isosphaera pallida]ADV61157.1 hypothetical protein Isop_0564 [Isosphaera pallida ATCC 43644]
MNPQKTTIADSETELVVQPPEKESRFLNYTSNAIPWYIHLIWVAYWVFVLAYVITWMVPAMQKEMVSPP